MAVAELAFALILALDRRIADNVVALRQAQWNKAEFSNAGGGRREAARRDPGARSGRRCGGLNPGDRAKIGIACKSPLCRGDSEISRRPFAAGEVPCRCSPLSCLS